MTNPNGNPDTFRFIDGEGDPIDLPRPTPDTDALVEVQEPELNLIVAQANEIARNDTRFHDITRVIIAEARFANGRIDVLTSQLKKAREERDDWKAATEMARESTAIVRRHAVAAEAKLARRHNALLHNRCGIHDSCADCHHENSNDEAETRTCIQRLHDDYHAAEAKLARVTKAVDVLVHAHRRVDFPAEGRPLWTQDERAEDMKRLREAWRRVEELFR